ncbi:MAG: hypothetical protein J6R05_04980 [Bacteroidaceae bacterium]|nr:hypothetical protein [Bacteroidaceae bacterium]
MERYALIHDKMPREFILLQGTGCRWRKCTFCDYHLDAGADPYTVNAPVLEKVSGRYGVLDIINSGSAPELDEQTISHIKRVVREKHIHTLWFEAHYMYRKRLAAFAAQFAPAQVKFRCGVETFDPTLRSLWKKGIPEHVSATDIAQYFQGICLLCCTQGESKEHILQDIELAKAHFEYFSVNVFCNNSTPVKQDPELAEWFIKEVYPLIKDDKRIEVLIQNTDLGVGGEEAL